MNYKCERCSKEVNEKFGSGRFCSRACANAKTWTAEDKAKKSKAAKKSIAVQNVVAAMTGKLKVDRITKPCLLCQKNFTTAITRNRIFCSAICSKEANRINLDGKYGGYRPTAGRGKHGWYKGIWCDSSWELAWVMYHLDHAIPFTRCTERFPYEYQGKKYTYNPDFMLAGAYIEVKGFIDAKVQAKLDAFPHQLQLLKKQDMQPYLNYAKNTYGNNFAELYDLSS